MRETTDRPADDPEEMESVPESDRPLVRALLERFSSIGHIYPDIDICLEVLRQMEWVRRHCIAENTLIEQSEDGAIFATKIEQPLSLAPDDWQP